MLKPPTRGAENFLEFGLIIFLIAVVVFTWFPIAWGLIMDWAAGLEGAFLFPK